MDAPNLSMKVLPTLKILILGSIVMLSSAAFGQATRTAYIDAAKILKRLPEAQDAQTKLDQLMVNWNQEAEEIQAELTRKRTDFERRKLIMTDAERSSAEVDLQNVQKRLNDFRQTKYGNGGELFNQQTSMMKPAYDRLLKAIEEIARDGNYDYVLDKSSRDVSMLYSNTKHDLTPLVAKKLGIETDAIMQPLINTSSKPGPQGGRPGTRPGMNPDANVRPDGTVGVSNPNTPTPPRANVPTNTSPNREVRTEGSEPNAGVKR